MTLLTIRQGSPHCSTSAKEQYDKANSQLRGKLGLRKINGAFTYDTARESALHEATASRFSYDRDFYERFISQNLGSNAVAAYKACLTYDKQSPGLRVWLDHREGDYYF